MTVMCCMYCAMLMHSLCMFPTEELSCCCGGKGFLDEVEQVFGRRGPKPNKPGANMSDPLSTGRKRAAVVYSKEFFASEPICAWKGLKHAGGGPVPIVGCPGNVATDRHHGPDKSVLNNEPLVNLHAICSWCHHRWHAVNDNFYLPVGWEKGDPEPRPENGDAWLPVDVKWFPHNAEEEADEILVKLHESWWNLSNYQRDKIGSFDDYARTHLGRPEHSSGADAKAS